MDYFMICAIIVTVFGMRSECSKVIDMHAENQKNLNISKYCGKVGKCTHGSHVICQYYNPNRVMGPRCDKVVSNVSITSDSAQLILDITNKIRTKAANGLLKGQDGEPLPRGYGIYRVEWDTELATFAQIWANQCMMSYDSCRSTDRFPNVGQAMGIVRFSQNDWQPLNGDVFNSTNLTPEKVKYSVVNVLRAWYDQKQSVTPEIIRAYNAHNPNLINNRFLQMISGSITHMGCGISGYSEHSYREKQANMNFNAVEMVCNYSTKNVMMKPIYNVEVPMEPGYTTKCGCPPGFDEDESCLCYGSGRKYLPSCKENGQCKPAVVVLPIFTAEDSSPGSITQAGNFARSKDATSEFFYNLESLYNPLEYNAAANLATVDNNSFLDTTRKIPKDVIKRYFDKKSNIMRVSGGPHTRRHMPRQSIFSKVEIFRLPAKNAKTTAVDLVASTFKNDVIPRKDFATAKKLVTSYLQKKKNGKIFDESDSDGYMSHGEEIPNNKAKTNSQLNPNIEKTDTMYYVSSVQTGENFNATKTSLKHTDIKPKEDNNLLYLLDKLEQEVNNVDLNINERGFFDEKIRKIYGTLVGKLDLLERKHKVLNKDSDNQTNTAGVNLKTITEIDKLHNDKDVFELHDSQYSYRNIDNDRFNSHKNNINNSDRTLSRRYQNEAQNGDFHRVNSVEERRLRHTYDVRNSDKYDHEGHYARSEGDGYHLESERRKYYHDKLKDLQNRINIIKRYDLHEDVQEDRRIRPVRPTKQELHRHRRPRDPINTFYIPDRARFLHGY